MATLFVSHSSQDDAKADALEAWLKAHGFADLFVDHKSIAGGAKWAEALRVQTGAAPCRGVPGHAQLASVPGLRGGVHGR
ncbi:MAG TPA: hypothetical protein DCL48_01395, partial [Alphaproteobacteria bacterium]|nr:hypothetical protein [Alphaproteobacteria bacterium]